MRQRLDHSRLGHDLLRQATGPAHRHGDHVDADRGQRDHGRVERRLAAWNAAPLHAERAMRLVSTAFEEGAPIPKKFTADGSDVSPPLEWMEAPAETRSFALISD